MDEETPSLMVTWGGGGGTINILGWDRSNITSRRGRGREGDYIWLVKPSVQSRQQVETRFYKKR